MEKVFRFKHFEVRVGESHSLKMHTIFVYKQWMPFKHWPQNSGLQTIKHATSVKLSCSNGQIYRWFTYMDQKPSILAKINVFWVYFGWVFQCYYSVRNRWPKWLWVEGKASVSASIGLPQRYIAEPVLSYCHWSEATVRLPVEQWNVRHRFSYILTYLAHNCGPLWLSLSALVPSALSPLFFVPALTFDLWQPNAIHLQSLPFLNELQPQPQPQCLNLSATQPFAHHT